MTLRPLRTCSAQTGPGRRLSQCGPGASPQANHIEKQTARNGEFGLRFRVLEAAQVRDVTAGDVRIGGVVEAGHGTQP